MGLRCGSSRKHEGRCLQKPLHSGGPPKDCSQNQGLEQALGDGDEQAERWGVLGEGRAGTKALACPALPLPAPTLAWDIGEPGTRTVPERGPTLSRNQLQSQGWSPWKGVLCLHAALAQTGPAAGAGQSAAAGSRLSPPPSPARCGHPLFQRPPCHGDSGPGVWQGRGCSPVG